jgi:microcystin-dependent protein
MADIYASNWTETDASNSAAAPDGAPEGMAPSGLNDVLRAHQGAIKRYVNQQSPTGTGGTSTAFTLTYTVAPGALVSGMTHRVEFHAANGAAATLNVNGLGAIPLYYYSSGAWRAAPAALFDANQTFLVSYHSASGTYRIHRPGADPTGTVKDFAGSTVPGGYLLCYGQAIGRAGYAGLFNALGTTHGVGDGSTTFNLPDLRARVTGGKPDMGGSDIGILTSATVPGSPGLGAKGGAQTNTATTTVSGSATGTVSGNTDIEAGGTRTDGANSNAVSIPGHTHTFSASANLAVGATGTSSNFSVVQPTMILNKMIAV